MSLGCRGTAIATTALPCLLLVLLAASPVAAATAHPATSTQATPTENATIHHEGDRLTLEAAPGQTISGTTTLTPGEPVSVRLRSTSESPFLRTIETTTGANGSFEGQVDLHNVDPGATFEVVVLHDGTQLTTDSGVVTACTSNCEPTATETTPEPGNSDPQQTVTDDWPSEDDWLAESIILTYRGRTVTIPINVDDTAETPDSATITIGDQDVNYVLNATVRDTSGDGRVALLFNTANAGFDAPTLAVEGNDELTVHSETNLPSPLDAGNYDITVFRYDSTTEEVDIGTLVVNEALNGTITPGTTTTRPQSGSPAVGTAPTTVGDGTANTSNGPFQNTNLLGLGALAAGGILAIVGVAVMLGLVRS